MNEKQRIAITISLFLFLLVLLNQIMYIPTIESEINALQYQVETDEFSSIQKKESSIDSTHSAVAERIEKLVQKKKTAIIANFLFLVFGIGGLIAGAVLGDRKEKNEYDDEWDDEEWEEEDEI